MNIKLQIYNRAKKILTSEKIIGWHDFATGPNRFRDQITVEGSISENSDLLEKCDSIVIFPQFAGGKIMNLLAFSLGYAFLWEGYKPLIIHDIPSCDHDEFINYTNKEVLSNEFNRYHTNWFCKRFPVECLTTYDVLSSWQPPGSLCIPRDPDSQIMYKGVNLSDPALSITRRNLKRYSINLRNDSHYETYVKNVYEGCIIAETIEKLVKEYAPDLVMAWDVHYPRGKLPLAIANNHAISAYSYGGGYTKGKVSYGKADNIVPAGNFVHKDVSKRLLTTPLSEQQSNRLEMVLNMRESGHPDYNKHTTHANLSVNEGEKFRVGIFSHLLWDGALTPKESLYSDFSEWLEDTINIGKQLSNVEFILKAHPAESLFGTNESTLDLLNNLQYSLPNNFEFLGPNTDVDTYQLIKTLNAGIVYSSTVGLEMLVRGVPVLTGGHGPYKGLNISYDPGSIQEYQNCLKNIENIHLNEDGIKRARRLAYQIFVNKQTNFPNLYDYLSGDRIKISHDQIMSDLSPIVKKLISGNKEIAND